MSIYTLGIDIGSTASKCIMLADGKEIVAKSLIDVGAGTSGPQRAIDEVLAESGKTRRYYHLTKQGRSALQEKEMAWNTYARAMGRVLKGGACLAGA